MKILLFCKASYSFSILRPIELAAKQRGHQILWYASPNISGKFPFIQDHTFTSSIDEAERYVPDAIFVPGNAVPHFFRGVKVQVFHGFAGEKKGHFRIRHYFDLYLTQGPFFTREFQRLAKIHGDMEVKETGWPKIDPLFNGTVDTDDLSRKYQIAAEQKVILYAPTFSPKLTSAPYLIDELEAIGNTEVNGIRNKILIKFHPLMSSELLDMYQERFKESTQVYIADEDDLTPFLLLADLMISDTSSAVYEFLMFDKPVITFKTTTSKKTWVDISDPEKLSAECLKSLAAGKITDNPIKQEYHPYTDGRSAERMLDAVEKHIDEHGVPKRRKLDWWRRFKTRRSRW